jgi:hypothetical protein
MAEDFEPTAMVAYEAYRGAREGTVAGGLPMPVWEHLSVPEQAAWLAVAQAVYVPPDPPVTRSRAREG